MQTANFIAGRASAKGTQKFRATNPSTQQFLEGNFVNATAEEIDMACLEAKAAFEGFKASDGAIRAKLLRTIAEDLEAAGDILVKRAMSESGLPEGRIMGERGRTCGQLRLFADLLEEGSWVNAVIDEAMPERQPPRADIRRMYEALGPVAVFGASNFPLAFSTAGGDTASALAAGCPVVVKGHPSHPGTHAIVSEIISLAVKKTGLHKGVYSALQGASYDVGTYLVEHPAIKAVGFTGSLSGGRALMAVAQMRPEPIPVFAEMGSINPIVVLKDKLQGESEPLAGILANSVNLGAGQFCTNPGILLLPQTDDTERFLLALAKAFGQLSPQTMLNKGIFNNYTVATRSLHRHSALQIVHSDQTEDDTWRAQPVLARISAKNFMADSSMQHEIFGPFTMAVICEGNEEIVATLDNLHGQLTGSIFGGLEELNVSNDIIAKLKDRVGRLIFNNVPTGVEVCHAMHHGGPFPSSSDSRFTSVGTGAIERFVRPICYQDCPDTLLPDALKAMNPLKIWRKVNGHIQR